MTTTLLLLGHNRDYYGTDTNADHVASAVRKAVETPQHMSLGEAFLEYVSDCSIVIPADQLYSYGASFPKYIPASTETTLVG